jgi:cytosine/adenosine deaminase-related metal-dependent hydrolase
MTRTHTDATWLRTDSIGTITVGKVADLLLLAPEAAP